MKRAIVALTLAVVAIAASVALASEPSHEPYQQIATDLAGT